MVSIGSLSMFDTGMRVMIEVQTLRTMWVIAAAVARVPPVPQTKAMAQGINIVYLIQIIPSRRTAVAQGVTVILSETWNPYPVLHTLYYIELMVAGFTKFEFWTSLEQQPIEGYCIYDNYCFQIIMKASEPPYLSHFPLRRWLYSGGVNNVAALLIENLVTLLLYYIENIVIITRYTVYRSWLK